MYNCLLVLLLHAAQLYLLTDHWKIQSIHFGCWVSSTTLIKEFSIKFSFGSKLTQAQVSSRTLSASDLIQISDTLISTYRKHFQYLTQSLRPAKTLRWQRVPQYIDIATLQYLVQHKDVTRLYSSYSFFSLHLELTVLSVTLNIVLVATWSLVAIWPCCLVSMHFYASYIAGTYHVKNSCRTCYI